MAHVTESNVPNVFIASWHISTATEPQKQRTSKQTSLNSSLRLQFLFSLSVSCKVSV